MSCVAACCGGHIQSRRRSKGTTSSALLKSPVDSSMKCVDEKPRKMRTFLATQRNFNCCPLRILAIRIGSCSVASGPFNGVQRTSAARFGSQTFRIRHAKRWLAETDLWSCLTNLPCPHGRFVAGKWYYIEVVASYVKGFVVMTAYIQDEFDGAESTGRKA